MKQVRKYTAIIGTQLNDRFAYAGDLFVQSISIVMFLWIFMQLWSATYRSSGETVIQGLSLEETMWYLMAAEVIMLSVPRVYRTISDQVKDGSIAYILNKPYDYVLYHLSASLGDLLPRAIFNTIAGGTVVWLMVGQPPHLKGIIFLLVAFLFAWLIDFCFSTLIGLAAFISEEVTPFYWIYSKLLLVAGGVLIPLDFFPAWLQKVCFSLPFAYTIYGPARLFIDPTLERLGALLSGQLFWLGLAASVLFLAYRSGIRRLVINGG